MEIRPTKVLLIEDDAKDAAFILGTFTNSKSKSFELEHVSQLKSGIERLADRSIEIVMLDLTLAGAKGLEGLQKVKAAAPTLPVIVLTTLGEEAVGVKAVSEGAQDYWIKDTKDSMFLTSALRYSVKRKQIQMMKEDFFGTVAHELNTPIAIIREGVSQVLDGLCGDITDDQQRQLTIVLKNVDWLRGITNDLLRSK